MPPRVIWSQSGNPTDYASKVLGIERWQLRAALHKIKARSNLGATDDIAIYDDGKVTDAHGDEVGNIHDEH